MGNSQDEVRIDYTETEPKMNLELGLRILRKKASDGFERNQFGRRETDLEEREREERSTTVKEEEVKKVERGKMDSGADKDGRGRRDQSERKGRWC